jgi:hypothetical protein
MNQISSKIHGILDYIVVIFLWASPTLFELPEKTAAFTYILGAVHLVLTIFTNFEYGIIRFIPLKIHGVIELIVSLALVGFAFFMGSREGDIARNFYLGFSMSVFIVWIFSDYTNKPKGKQEIPYLESNTDGGMI